MGTARTAALLGASAFWAAAAAACVGCSPLLLSVETGFLSDGDYIGLVALAMWAGVRWLRQRRGLGLVIALGMLAPLQRQVGLGILFALLVMECTRRNGDRRARTLIALAFATAVVTVGALQALVGAYSGKLGSLLSATVVHPNVLPLLGILLEWAPVVGLVVAPLSIGLLARRGPRLTVTVASPRRLMPPVSHLSTPPGSWSSRPSPTRILVLTTGHSLEGGSWSAAWTGRDRA